MTAITDEMVERAAFAVEKDKARAYGWNKKQFDVWFYRDPLFVSKINVWGHFRGTQKEKLLHECRLALEAALEMRP